MAAALTVVTAGPAWAHGIGDRSDLPLPPWMFASAAGLVLVVSFVALGVLWHRPRIDAVADGRVLPGWFGTGVRILEWPLRVLGLALFTVTLVAAIFGNIDPARNLAPVMLYVAFWVGLQVVSSLVGDLWRVLSPYETLALIVSRIRAAVSGRAARTVRPEGFYWFAAAGLFGFLWLELAYHDPASPRTLALAIGAYSTAVLVAAAVWGRQWLRTGEAFSALFGLMAYMAPFHRDEEGRWRVRSPLVGLVRLTPLPGMETLILVALGGTAFDGFTRTTIWANAVAESTDWTRTGLSTLGLLWGITLMTAIYVGAMAIAARVTGRGTGELRGSFLHSLVPIAFAYTVAHYFSLLVFEGQNVTTLLSDPLGRGWDLFGTAGNEINYQILSPDPLVTVAVIAWVQAGVIVLGHVAGVVLAHDRAVELLPATRVAPSQYPLLVAMVLYTMGGLLLMVGG